MCDCKYSLFRTQSLYLLLFFFPYHCQKTLVNPLNLFKHFNVSLWIFFPAFLLPALKRLPDIIIIKETSSIFSQISCSIVLLITLVSIFCNKNFRKGRQDDTTQRTSSKGAVCIFTKLSQAIIQRAFGRSSTDLQQLHTTVMKEYLRKVNLVVLLLHECMGNPVMKFHCAAHFNFRTSRTYHKCQT